MSISLITRRAAPVAAALALLASPFAVFAAITLTPDSTDTPTYTQGATLNPLTVTMTTDSDDSGLITKINLTDDSGASVNFDQVFGAFSLTTTVGATTYPTFDAPLSDSTITYGDPTNGYSVTSGTPQSTVLTGAISPTAQPGTYTLTTSVQTLAGEERASLEGNFVVKQSQTITFGPLADKTTDDADFDVSATADSGLPVSFDAHGTCTVSGATVHLTGAGTCTITASQAGDDTYAAADDVNQAFEVTAPIYRYASPTGDAGVDGTDETHPTTLEHAVATAPDGAKIYLAAGEYDLTSMLTIDSSVSLIGADGTTIKSNNGSWSTDNTGKHLIDVYADGVALENLTLDSNGQSYGVQFYEASGSLTDVTIENSKGAGLTVNGSDVTATNLTTSGNIWGAVNVDPGSGVTVPSSFTLSGNGSLSEEKQIWSDGDHVTGGATVTVDADGYQRHHNAGDSANAYYWSNREVEGSVTIQGDPTDTLYPTIGDALAAAVDGDTINVGPGDYNLVPDDTTVVEGQTGWYLAITKNGITLRGVDASGNPITDASDVQANIYSTHETANGNWPTQDLILVDANNVTIQGLGIMNKISPNKGVEVLGDNFTATDDLFAPISASLMPDVADYTDTDGSLHNDISKYGSGVYFNNSGATDARTGAVTDSIFQNSGVTFDSFGSNWNVEITGNTFDGNKSWTWSGGTDYYSAVGATTWANQPDFSGSTIAIHGNQFVNMADDQVVLKIKDGMTGVFDATGNYWGASTGPTTAMIYAPATGEIDYSPWLCTSDVNGETSDVNNCIATYTIDSSVDGGGTISPEGTVTLNEGASQTFSFSAGRDNEASSVTVDGQDIDLDGATSYTFSDVTGDHTIVVHFTAAQTSRSGGGGGGGGSSGGSTGGSTGGGQVLGAATYNFTTDLTVGSTGADVSALQQILIDAGFLHIAAPTGYFGDLTKTALAAFQAAHGISPAAGYFGPLTRAYLASNPVPTTTTTLSDAQKEAIQKQIEDILEQIKKIQDQIASMQS
jgi:hypothetical protein